MSAAAPDGVRIEQVWFSGVHADVGAGYVTRKLAAIRLIWMTERAQEEGLELPDGPEQAQSQRPDARLAGCLLPEGSLAAH